MKTVAAVAITVAAGVAVIAGTTSTASDPPPVSDAGPGCSGARSVAVRAAAALVAGRPDPAYSPSLHTAIRPSRLTPVSTQVLDTVDLPGVSGARSRCSSTPGPDWGGDRGARSPRGDLSCGSGGRRRCGPIKPH